MNSHRVHISRSLAACLLVFAGLGCAAAAEALPDGPGLSKRFPRDKGIAQHPAVIFAESFEAGSLAELEEVLE